MKKLFKYKNAAALNNDLGAAIKKIRNQSEYKQIELAEAIGANRSYVSELESGKRNPTVETLVFICTALKVPISEIFKAAESL